MFRVPIASPFVVSYPTSIVSNIVSVAVFETFYAKSCDLDLGQFKVIQGHGANR